MDKIKLYSKEPQSVGEFFLTSKEYCQYLYLPIKMAGSVFFKMEPRILFISDMVYAVTADQITKIGTNAFKNKYVYLTLKQTFIAKETHHNRPGWHSDGFGTDDVQYIWFDKFPTEFMCGEFEVSDSDEDSMKDFDTYSKLINFGSDIGYYHKPETFHLYYIDQNHIHRTTPATSDGVRTFIKITVSSHIYAQEGNSRNYELQYDWELSPRHIDRNQPHAKS